MDKTFWIVAYSLNWMASKINMTYNEINIIVYYLLIPLSWTIMLDLIVGLPIFTVLFLLMWSYILVKTRNCFRKWCDIWFGKSREFLLLFKGIGWTYEVASVIICVLVPLVIYGLLAYGIYLKYF